jgi:hypothetical protein
VFPALHHQGNQHPDDAGSKHLWNVGKLLPDYTAQQPRRQSSSRFFSSSSLPDRPAHSVSYPIRTKGSFPQEKGGGSMKLTSHFQIIPRCIAATPNCMLQGHVRTPPPLLRGPKSPVQLCYAASSELSLLAWAPLFVLQRCTIFMWPWSMQFGDCLFNAWSVVFSPSRCGAWIQRSPDRYLLKLDR